MSHTVRVLNYSTAGRRRTTRLEFHQAQHTNVYTVTHPYTEIGTTEARKLTPPPPSSSLTDSPVDKQLDKQLACSQSPE